MEFIPKEGMKPLRDLANHLAQIPRLDISFFTKEIERKIGKGSPSNLELRIVNDYLSGQMFTGDLIIRYNGEDHTVVRGLRVRVFGELEE